MTVVPVAVVEIVCGICLRERFCGDVTDSLIGFGCSRGVNDIHTSAISNNLHFSPCSCSVSSGLNEAQPFPYTKNGRLGSVSMQICVRKFK